MKNNNGLLTFFLTNSLFLGGGLSIIFKHAKNDSYIAITLGTFLGIGILYIIHKWIINRKLTTILKIIYLLYIITLLIIIFTSLSTFISSYYLTKTPAILSCIPIIILAVYNSKSVTKISYVALPLLFISIVIFIFKSSILVVDIDINNIFPILNTNINDIFKATLIYAILSTSPSLLLINEKMTYKQALKNYLISSLFLIITSFILIATLGNLITTLSYPEYSVLRKIRLLKFIENIEGILAITWIFDIFIALSLASYQVKQLFNKKNNYIPFCLLTSIMFFIYLSVNSNYSHLLIIYHYHILVLLIITMLLMTTILIFSNKKTSV